ncbi:C-type isolectin Sp-CL4-like [Entelurus aequoreus]|uniref:C-type isolectin Sp-CL4-like n=1 Tax=Entelurus aequoreus TaxID=161455 RepID=UPI002B1D484E|nr:C-type isolectin Sp-CL4-like [Entelurus aequoreus]
MPSAVTTILLMGALMVAPAYSWTDAEVAALCATTELQPCDAGEYRLNDDSCVKFLTSQMTFKEAQEGCQLDDGAVVKLTSHDEHKKLVCMMFAAFPLRLHYWIGAKRGPDAFEWIHGGEPLETAPWREGQPDNFNGNENCVWMNSGSWGPINDGPCSELSSVPCQIAK